MKRAAPTSVKARPIDREIEDVGRPLTMEMTNMELTNRSRPVLILDNVDSRGTARCKLIPSTDHRGHWVWLPRAARRGLELASPASTWGEFVVTRRQEKEGLGRGGMRSRRRVRKKWRCGAPLVPRSPEAVKAKAPVRVRQVW